MKRQVKENNEKKCIPIFQNFVILKSRKRRFITDNVTDCLRMILETCQAITFEAVNTSITQAGISNIKGGL